MKWIKKMFILKFCHCSIKVDVRNIKVSESFMCYWFIVQWDKHSDMECLMTQQNRFRMEDGIHPLSWSYYYREVIIIYYLHDPQVWY